MTDLDALRGIVSDLQGQVSRLATKGLASSAVSTPGAAAFPYWDVVMVSGLTLAGDDWDPLFDDAALADRRVLRLGTSAGEIATFGTHGLNLQKRYSIQWDSSVNVSVPCSLSGWYEEIDEDPGQVQIKLNGVVQTLSPSPQLLTLDVKEGRNRLSICVAGHPILMTFTGVLFDGTFGKWVAER